MTHQLVFSLSLHLSHSPGTDIFFHHCKAGDRKQRAARLLTAPARPPPFLLVLCNVMQEERVVFLPAGPSELQLTVDTTGQHPGRKCPVCVPWTMSSQSEHVHYSLVFVHLVLLLVLINGCLVSDNPLCVALIQENNQW